jgi:hypothetical protein
MSNARDPSPFVLVSLDRSAGPSGGDGADWIHYKIAQGENIVSGYRRGNMGGVRTYVEGIVTALNDRRALKRGRVNLVNDSTRPRAAPVTGNPQ